MPVSNDSKIEVLNDHYNHTFEIVKDILRRRDWMMSYAILLLILQFFQISDPNQTSVAIISFIKNSYGIEISIGKMTINAILWFVLLVIVVRYYQAGIHLNKQYKYLHHLEKEFSDLFGKDIITREGKSYLKDYPVFSSWIHFVYTWVYPIFLIMVLTYNIFRDWKGCAFLFTSYGICFVCYLMIMISTILYLHFCYKVHNTYSTSNDKNGR